MSMRVLVTGSRTWPNRDAVRRALDECLRVADTGLVVVHGACGKGPDAMAALWVEQWARKDAFVVAEAYPAPWTARCKAQCHPNHRRCQAKLNQGIEDDHSHICAGRGGHGPHQCTICGLGWRQPEYVNTCPAAGIYRNNFMVSLGADMCLAFIMDSSAGATHCSDAANRAGIDTIVFTATSR